ncbi:MAG TPA: DUF3168 domain-containing protein [Candidatus Binatia bacterium]|nr:DUF3168 domain-containing protein [Candidatus Binatia bacterium]
MSAERALLAAIRETALQCGPLQALLSDRIYDDPPADAVFPYLTLGRVESRPTDAASRDALEHAITLHAWSRHGGRAETLDIIAALRGALHNAQPVVSGHKLVLLLATFADVFRSGDGRTTHGVLRLRAITEPE